MKGCLETLLPLLRLWQVKALEKCITWWFQVGIDNHFILNTAPASGKTKASCAIAQMLFERGEIERVIVIAPQIEVVDSWAEDFEKITGRVMGKVTAKDGDLSQVRMDICATWHAVLGLQQELQSVCLSQPTLVICDESHHAAVSAAWGSSGSSAFAQAKFVLVLSGTPYRSDGRDSLYLETNGRGNIQQPEAGRYELNYGEAVELGYCRPATFHRHQGTFQVNLDEENSLEVSGYQSANLTGNLRSVPGLQNSLDFYRLACVPQYESDNMTPMRSGFQGTMMEYGSQKLDDLRLRMHNAGGLVIAPSIAMAEYFCDLIELVEGERPLLVHSELNNAESRIKLFRKGTMRWIVSVDMISEGVDIPRLRVLVYLPRAQTELKFRQALGRVVRSTGPEDDTRAYVIMPSFQTFDAYARRAEQEMPRGVRRDPGPARSKVCPICESESAVSAKTCRECGHDFPRTPPRLKPCAECDGLNEMSAEDCIFCGHSFTSSFSITLTEALRTGAIAHGMDISENEVQASEEIAHQFREGALKSGDEILIKLVTTHSEESFWKIVNFCAPYAPNNTNQKKQEV